jgi:hypothetical protein
MKREGPALLPAFFVSAPGALSSRKLSPGTLPGFFLPTRQSNRMFWRGGSDNARTIVPARRLRPGSRVRSPPPLPARPVEFAEFGRIVAVRCPQDFAHILQRAGGVWEPGTRRWLVERRRIGPVIRALQRATDPLFRRAGLTLDEV